MPPDDLIGATLGSYRVTAKLGQGGMGAVYLAEHPALGRKAAVKVLLPELSAHGEAIERFFHEARTTAKLRHPAMVDVFDYGTLPDGRAYLVMDFLEGESLQARLERGGAMPVPQALDLVREIALGMSVAHAETIVHRDLKPDNIFVLPPVPGARAERVKILDFGIAKLTHKEGANVSVTRTGALLGTPLYMSPEQCRGTGDIDHRADIYSLGCILFTMLAGRPPFQSEGMGELLAMHLFEPAPSLASAGARVSEDVERLVARTLAKSAADRFPTMLALAEEIARVLAKPSAGAPTTPSVKGTAILSAGAVIPAGTVGAAVSGTKMVEGGGRAVGRSTLSDAAHEGSRDRGEPRGSGAKLAIGIGAVVVLAAAGVAAFVLGRPAPAVPPEKTASAPAPERPRPAVAPAAPIPEPVAPERAAAPATEEQPPPAGTPPPATGKKPRPATLSSRRGTARGEKEVSPPTEEKRSDRPGRPVYKGTKLRIEKETPYD